MPLPLLATTLLPEVLETLIPRPPSGSRAYPDAPAQAIVASPGIGTGFGQTCPGNGPVSARRCGSVPKDIFPITYWTVPGHQQAVLEKQMRCIRLQLQTAKSVNDQRFGTCRLDIRARNDAGHPFLEKSYRPLLREMAKIILLHRSPLPALKNSHLLRGNPRKAKGKDAQGLRDP